MADKNTFVHSIQDENKLGSLSHTLKDMTNVANVANLNKHLSSLHESQQSLQTQLHRVETLASQTNVDLEQLFARSKSNNENLNKLLSSMVEYSRDVTTEGNATKADMKLILDALDQIKSASGYAREVKEQLASSRDESSRDSSELKSTMAELLAEVHAAMAKIVQRQDEVSSRLSDGATMSARDKDEVLDSLRQVQVLLNKERDIRRDFEVGVTRKTDEIRERLESDSGTSRTTQEKLLHCVEEVKNLLETQAQEQLLLKRTLNLQHDYDTIQHKYDSLTENFNSLNEKYNEKFQQYQSLMDKFRQLSAQVADHEVSVASPLPHIANLQKFHHHALKSLDSQNIKQEKRIATMPTNFTNNSDDD
ncbi:uncharacterized protein LODBEIA_P43260 [Lodderomyces beijingensis]|uniref:Autophagy-related protein 17 n=1 Tax=Lodderomyces beijingensis TaxID=1775926 RepID=A0ABP0ZRW9_9ASCO